MRNVPMFFLLLFFNLAQQSHGGKSIEEPAENVSSKNIISHVEKNFLGNSLFIIKNCENLSQCITWDAFHTQYGTHLRPFKKPYLAGESLFTLPHYNDGSCLWHALGVSVVDTYDLIVESARDILDKRVEAKNVFQGVEANLVQKKTTQEDYEEALKKGIEGKQLENIFNAYKESPEEKRERTESENNLSILEAALEETFNALFPEENGKNDLERLQSVERLVLDIKAQDENKHAFINRAKEHGGKVFEINGVRNAIRPLHNAFFFQKVADHLGVAIHIFHEEEKKEYVPSERSSLPLTTLYLHGTVRHYEPVLKQNQCVSLALIRDMENHLKISSGNALKVTKETYVNLPFKSVEKSEEKKPYNLEKIEQERKDAELAKKLEQERKDAELAKKLEQEEGDELLARALADERYEQN